MNNKLIYITLLVAWLSFNVVSMIIPLNHTIGYWSTLFFSNVAFFIQLIIWKSAIEDKNCKKNNFMIIPIICVGIFYLIIQLVLFIIFSFIGNVPAWFSITVCLIVLTMAVLLIILGNVNKNKHEYIENKF